MIKTELLKIGGIPTVVWGEPANKAYIYVHGKLSNKECAAEFAEIAGTKGYQTVSFDLSGHGERKDENYACNVWNGISDLTKVADFVFEKWNSVALYGCSLGAFFSLHAYKERNFEKCLFQSPIVDMEYLICRMFDWFGASEAELKTRGEIYTPVDTLSWKYYTFVKENPTDVWKIPTNILYGAKDQLQSLNVIQKFAAANDCGLTVSENSDHPFMEDGDSEIVREWLAKFI